MIGNKTTGDKAQGYIYTESCQHGKGEQQKERIFVEDPQKYLYL